MESNAAQKGDSQPLQAWAWTEAEDTILLEHVRMHGTRKWKELVESGRLLQRSTKACCNRFRRLRELHMEGALRPHHSWDLDAVRSLGQLGPGQADLQALLRHLSADAPYTSSALLTDPRTGFPATSAAGSASSALLPSSTSGSMSQSSIPRGAGLSPLGLGPTYLQQGPRGPLSPSTGPAWHNVLADSAQLSQSSHLCGGGISPTASRRSLGLPPFPLSRLGHSVPGTAAAGRGSSDRFQEASSSSPHRQQTQGSEGRSLTVAFQELVTQASQRYGVPFSSSGRQHSSSVLSKPRSWAGGYASCGGHSLDSTLVDRLVPAAAGQPLAKIPRRPASSGGVGYASAGFSHESRPGTAHAPSTSLVDELSQLMRQEASEQRQDSPATRVPRRYQGAASSLALGSARRCQSLEFPRAAAPVGAPGTLSALPPHHSAPVGLESEQLPCPGFAGTRLDSMTSGAFDVDGSALPLASFNFDMSKGHLDSTLAGSEGLARSFRDAGAADVTATPSNPPIPRRIAALAASEGGLGSADRKRKLGEVSEGTSEIHEEIARLLGGASWLGPSVPSAARPEDVSIFPGTNAPVEGLSNSAAGALPYSLSSLGSGVLGPTSSVREAAQLVDTDDFWEGAEGAGVRYANGEGAQVDLLAAMGQEAQNAANLSALVSRYNELVQLQDMRSNSN